MGNAPLAEHPNFWQYLFRTGPAFDREAYIDRELDRARHAARGIAVASRAVPNPTSDVYLELFGRVGRPAVPALVAALDDPDDAIQAAAAEALLRIGSET